MPVIGPVEIGENAKVGAAAVVVDVPSDVTVVGIQQDCSRSWTEGWTNDPRSRRKREYYVNKLEQAREASHRSSGWQDTYKIQARNKLSQEELSEAKN